MFAFREDGASASKDPAAILLIVLISLGMF